MNARTRWMFGLAALGLMAIAPVHATPNLFMDEAFIVAKREADREVRSDEREPRKEERRGMWRDDEREAPRGYGYGYERRQQHRNEEGDRPRERR